MKNTDLLVIGGSAGGILSATTARKAYGKDIDITLIRNTEKVMVPCGIPYIFGTLRSSDKNVIPDNGLLDANVNLVIDNVISIDRENKIAKTETGEEYRYKKLIMATGSLPVIPTFIPGYDLENVVTIVKNKVILDEIFDKVDAAENVAIVGGGFIGVEFAEQIRQLGKNVTLIELADTCVSQAFDKEYASELEDSLKEMGVNVLTGTKVSKINGSEKVESLELGDGNTLAADLVVLAMGVKANSKLAADAGLELNGKGAIKVDQYMRTSDPSIFAVGDCAEKRCFFTHKDVPVLLASSAAMEAKIAGSNVFQLRLVRANKGTISAFATKVNGRTYAAAGLTEKRTADEGFTTMVGNFTTTSRHPGSLPGTVKIKMKLIFSKCSGVILGAQVSGDDSAGEMINILSLAIQKGLTATELNTFQVATHPLISASPIMYPINGAAMEAIASNCGHLNADFVLPEK